MVDRCLLFVYKRIGDEIAFMGVRVLVYREEGASIDSIMDVRGRKLAPSGGVGDPRSSR